METDNKTLGILLLSLLLALLLAACGSAVEEPTAEENEPVAPVTVEMEEVTPEAGEDDEPQEAPAPGIPDPELFMTEQVTTALADRLDVDLDAVSVMSVTAMEWADAALGCPDPDLVYADVVTPGFEIVLSVDGETYTYHTDSSGALVLCGSDGRPQSEDS